MQSRTSKHPQTSGAVYPLARSGKKLEAVYRQWPGPPPHTNGRRIKTYTLKHRLPAEWALPLAAFFRPLAMTTPRRSVCKRCCAVRKLISPLRGLQRRLVGLVDLLQNDLCSSEPRKRRTRALAPPAPALTVLTQPASQPALKTHPHDSMPASRGSSLSSQPHSGDQRCEDRAARPSIWDSPPLKRAPAGGPAWEDDSVMPARGASYSGGGDDQREGPLCGMPVRRGLELKLDEEEEVMAPVYARPMAPGDEQDALSKASPHTHRQDVLSTQSSPVVTGRCGSSPERKTSPSVSEGIASSRVRRASSPQCRGELKAAPPSPRRASSPPHQGGTSGLGLEQLQSSSADPHARLPPGEEQIPSLMSHSSAYELGCKGSKTAHEFAQSPLSPGENAPSTRAGPLVSGRRCSAPENPSIDLEIASSPVSIRRGSAPQCRGEWKAAALTPPHVSSPPRTERTSEFKGPELLADRYGRVSISDERSLSFLRRGSEPQLRCKEGMVARESTLPPPSHGQHGLFTESGPGPSGRRGSAPERRTSPIGEENASSMRRASSPQCRGESKAASLKLPPASSPPLQENTSGLAQLLSCADRRAREDTGLEQPPSLRRRSSEPEHKCGESIDARVSAQSPFLEGQNVARTSPSQSQERAHRCSTQSLHSRETEVSPGRTPLLPPAQGQVRASSRSPCSRGMEGTRRFARSSPHEMEQAERESSPTRRSSAPCISSPGDASTSPFRELRSAPKFTRTAPPASELGHAGNQLLPSQESSELSLADTPGRIASPRSQEVSQRLAQFESARNRLLSSLEALGVEHKPLPSFHCDLARPRHSSADTLHGRGVSPSPRGHELHDTCDDFTSSGGVNLPPPSLSQHKRVSKQRSASQPPSMSRCPSNPESDIERQSQRVSGRNVWCNENIAAEVCILPSRKRQPSDQRAQTLPSGCVPSDLSRAGQEPALRRGSPIQMRGEKFAAAVTQQEAGQQSCPAEHGRRGSAPELQGEERKTALRCRSALQFVGRVGDEANALAPSPSTYVEDCARWRIQSESQASGEFASGAKRAERQALPSQRAHPSKLDDSSDDSHEEHPLYEQAEHKLSVSSAACKLNESTCSASCEQKRSKSSSSRGGAPKQQVQVAPISRRSLHVAVSSPDDLTDSDSQRLLSEIRTSASAMNPGSSLASFGAECHSPRDQRKESSQILREGGTGGGAAGGIGDDIEYYIGSGIDDRISGDALPPRLRFSRVMSERLHSAPTSHQVNSTNHQLRGGVASRTGPVQFVAQADNACPHKGQSERAFSQSPPRDRCASNTTLSGKLSMRRVSGLQHHCELSNAAASPAGVDSLPSSPSYGSDGGSGLDGDCSWSGGSSDNLPSTPEGRGPAFTSVPKEASYARRMESSSTKLQGASAWSRRASGLRTSEGSDALSGIFGLSPEEMEASLLLTGSRRRRLAELCISSADEADPIDVDDSLIGDVDGVVGLIDNYGKYDGMVDNENSFDVDDHVPRSLLRGGTHCPHSGLPSLADGAGKHRRVLLSESQHDCRARSSDEQRTRRKSVTLEEGAAGAASLFHAPSALSPPPPEAATCEPHTPGGVSIDEHTGCALLPVTNPLLEGAMPGEKLPPASCQTRELISEMQRILDGDSKRHLSPHALSPTRHARAFDEVPTSQLYQTHTRHCDQPHTSRCDHSNCLAHAVSCQGEEKNEVVASTAVERNGRAGVFDETEDHEALSRAVCEGGWWTTSTPVLPASINLCYGLPPRRLPLPSAALRRSGMSASCAADLRQESDGYRHLNHAPLSPSLSKAGDEAPAPVAACHHQPEIGCPAIAEQRASRAARDENGSVLAWERIGGAASAAVPTQTGEESRMQQVEALRSSKMTEMQKEMPSIGRRAVTHGGSEPWWLSHSFAEKGVQAPEGATTSLLVPSSGLGDLGCSIKSQEIPKWGESTARSCGPHASATISGIATIPFEPNARLDREGWAWRDGCRPQTLGSQTPAAVPTYNTETRSGCGLGATTLGVLNNHHHEPKAPEAYPMPARELSLSWQDVMEESAKTTAVRQRARVALDTHAARLDVLLGAQAASAPAPAAASAIAIDQGRVSAKEAHLARISKLEQGRLVSTYLEAAAAYRKGSRMTPHVSDSNVRANSYVTREGEGHISASPMDHHSLCSRRGDPPPSKLANAQNQYPSRYRPHKSNSGHTIHAKVGQERNGAINGVKGEQLQGSGKSAPGTIGQDEYIAQAHLSSDSLHNSKSPWQRAHDTSLSNVTAPDSIDVKFTNVVSDAVCERLRSLLPNADGTSNSVRALTFCVASDATGVPLQPEPVRELELWCALTWGQLYIGIIPVPYDSKFSCIFPAISTASLQRIGHGGGAVTLAIGAPQRYVVALKLRDEAKMIYAINCKLSRV